MYECLVRKIFFTLSFIDLSGREEESANLNWPHESVWTSIFEINGMIFNWNAKNTTKLPEMIWVYDAETREQKRWSSRFRENQWEREREREGKKEIKEEWKGQGEGDGRINCWNVVRKVRFHIWAPSSHSNPSGKNKAIILNECHIHNNHNHNSCSIHITGKSVRRPILLRIIQFCFHSLHFLAWYRNKTWLLKQMIFHFYWNASPLILKMSKFLDLSIGWPCSVVKRVIHIFI